LNVHGIATLLFDLLTENEERDRANVFAIRLLAERVVAAVRWSRNEPLVASLPIGLFGASTGAAAALVAAAMLGNEVKAIVSRGGRPDLAGTALSRVRAATLLIVGGADHGVIGLNQFAYDRLSPPKALEIVPGATHLFEERGAMETVVSLAAAWFGRHLNAADADPKGR
jgi:dienelactone hydrolase